jgi:nicotinamidase-related amidase
MAEIVGALPFKFIFDPETTAVMVIDMQRDFLEPNGYGAALGNDVTALKGIIPNVAHLLAAARRAGLLVIHTRECHAEDLSDCPAAKRERGQPVLRIGDPGPMGRILVAGEPGTEFVAELEPVDGEIVINKPGKGAFYATDLEDRLARLGIRSLIFSGVTTEVCVQTTMREANDRGFYCLLAEDATESYFPEFKAATIEMIRAQGAIIGWTAKALEIEGVLNG